MAGTTYLKVFSANGEYVAACKYYEDAAALVAFHGKGATVRFGHAKKDTLWTEGKDGTAGDSYDAAASYMRAQAQMIRDRYSAANAQHQSNRETGT